MAKVRQRSAAAGPHGASDVVYRPEAAQDEARLETGRSPAEKKKKRILYVEYSSDGSIGGSHHSLLHLIKDLDRTRYDPLVVFYRSHALVPEFERCACEVLFTGQPSALDIRKRLRQSGVDKLVKPVVFLLLLYQKIRNLVRRLLIPSLKSARLLVSKRIHLVHLNNSLFHAQEWMLAARMTGRKCVVHHRGYGAGRREVRYLCRLADAIICISDDIRKDLLALGAFPATKLSTIHNGIDVEQFRSAAGRAGQSVRAEFGVPCSAPLIGIVGNLMESKGQHIAIQALPTLLQEFEGLRCLIVGRPPGNVEDQRFHEYLTDLVRTNDLEQVVTFTGYRSDVARIMGALDVVVHAAIKPEAFGRVILEAMAMGKPVIATNLGGPREIIEDDVSGFLVPAGDPAALADALRPLLRDPARRTAVGMHARRRATERFSAAALTKKVEGIYNSLLN